MSRPTLSSPQLYTIAIVTALAKERTAAICMLDERHDEPSGFTQAAADNNSYSWGRIGKHNIVIASLAAGDYGTISASKTVDGILYSLPHIRIGLFVGIGAGLGEVHLGDVVVSQPSGTSGGVVQYDFKKSKDVDGVDTYERIGQLDRPPAALLNAVTVIQVEHRIEDSRINEYMQVFNTKKLQSYLRPSIAEQNSQRDLTIHYGIIASGNGLIKSATARDEIIADLAPLKPLCIEMEAAGVMNSFPCLVIRGICDYANKQKGDDWQEHAAGVAAAYAKELLQYVRPTQVEALKPLGDVSSINISNTGSGTVNTNYGSGHQSNYVQHGNNNRQINARDINNYREGWL